MTGAAILALARSRIGEAYRLGVSVDLDDPDYHGRLHGTPAPLDATTDRAWDCAELVSWAVSIVCDGKRVGCGPDGVEPYTGHWAQEIAVDTGPAYRIPVAEALWTPGAILLRAPAAGIGGHIGIATGTGRGIVEAHSTSVGVVERQDAHQRRWSAGVCVRGVQYLATGPTQGYAAPAGVLRQGQRGLLVERLQVALRTRGYDPGPTDGDYGPRTARAVRAYQIDRGLVPDGEAGPITLGALGVS
jgi:N-acetylmuramoyl-L-alanine amidase